MDTNGPTTMLPQPSDASTSALDTGEGLLLGGEGSESEQQFGGR